MKQTPIYVFQFLKHITNDIGKLNINYIFKELNNIESVGKNHSIQGLIRSTPIQTDSWRLTYSQQREAQYSSPCNALH